MGGGVSEKTSSSASGGLPLSAKPGPGPYQQTADCCPDGSIGGTLELTFRQTQSDGYPVLNRCKS